MTDNTKHAGFDRRFMLGAMGGALAAAASGLTPREAMSATPPTAPLPWWTSEGFVERAGGRIHWVSTGEGEPVILLHKLGGWIGDWNDMAPLMVQKGRRVIALDLPGHGQSTMLGKPPYVQTLEENGARIKAALEEIGVTRCAIVANSLGGCTSVIMAGCWPNLISKLALINVALFDKATPAEIAEKDAKTQSHYDAQDRPIAETEGSPQFGSINPNILIQGNLSRAAAGVWIRPSERGASVAGISDYLPRVTCPTLLIYASVGPYRQFEAIGRARLRDVRVEKIADSGVFTHQDQPVKTAEIVNAFLKG